MIVNASEKFRKKLIFLFVLYKHDICRTVFSQPGDIWMVGDPKSDCEFSGTTVRQSQLPQININVETRYGSHL